MPPTPIYNLSSSCRARSVKSSFGLYIPLGESEWITWERKRRVGRPVELSWGGKIELAERTWCGCHGTEWRPRIVQKKCLFLCNFSNRLLRHIISESQRHVQIARDPKYILFVEPYLSTYIFDGPVGLDHVRWTLSSHKRSFTVRSPETHELSAEATHDPNRHHAYLRGQFQWRQDLPWKGKPRSKSVRSMDLSTRPHCPDCHKPEQSTLSPSRYISVYSVLTISSSKTG